MSLQLENPSNTNPALQLSGDSPTLQLILLYKLASCAECGKGKTTLVWALSCCRWIRFFNEVLLCVFIYLLEAVLGLHCRMGSSLVAASGGFSAGRLPGCRAQAHSCDPTGMWGLPRSGTEPMPPALAGRVFTEQPGKSGASAVYPGDRVAGWEPRPTAAAQQPGRAADCMSLVQEEIKIQSSVSTGYSLLLHHFKAKES